MPMIAAQVMKAADDPNSCLDDIRKLIEQDSGIAARLLKMANSALYGLPSEIESLAHAIALLGTMTVKNLVLAASRKQTYRRFGLMEKLLWQHSSMSGPVAAKLATHPKIRVPTDVAFTAGLIHHIGKTALANSHRDEYEQVVSRVYNERLGFVEAEQDRFGFDHAELGGRVAELWKLPERLIATIRYHHDAGALAKLEEEDARLTATTTVTSVCLSKLGVGRSAPLENLDLASHPAWVFLDLGQEDVEPILELCSQQVKLNESMVS